MSKQFNNEQLSVERVRLSYDKVNRNSNAINHDLTELYTQDSEEAATRELADVILDARVTALANAHDLDPNKDEEVLLARDAVSTRGVVFDSVKQRLDAMDDESAIPKFVEVGDLASIISVPPETTAGFISDNNGKAFEASGLTLQNSVKNGDFSNGVSPWVGYQSTISISSNIATATATDINPSLYQTVHVKADDVYFLYGELKANSGNGKLRLAMSGMYTEVPSIVNGKWYSVSGRYYPNSTGNWTIETQYRDGTVAGDSWSSKKIMTINLTALNLEHLTDAQLLDICRQGYIDGVASVENLVALSRNVNTFDINKAIVGQQIQSGGNIASNSGTFLYSELNPTKTFTIAGNSYSGSLLVAFYSGSTWIAEEVFYGPSPSVFTLPDSADNYKVSCLIGDINKVMIVNGSVAPKEYIQYESSKVPLPVSLGSTPSGAEDKTYFQDSKVWKRSEVKTYVLKESDITKYDNYTNIGQAVIPLIAFDGIISQGSDIIGGSFVLNGFLRELGSINTDQAGNEWTFKTDSNNLYINVPLDHWADLAEARASLVALLNNVVYELATPEPPIQLPVPASLKLFPNGTVFVYSDTFFGEITMQAPLNEGAVQIGSDYATQGNANVKYAKKPRVRLKNTANQTIPHNILTRVQLPEIDELTGFFGIADNSVYVKEAGTYTITGGLLVTANNTGNRGIYIAIDGVSKAVDIKSPTPTGSTPLRISETLYLEKNARINLNVYQSSGIPLDTFYQSDWCTVLTITKC